MAEVAGRFVNNIGALTDSRGWACLTVAGRLVWSRMFCREFLESKSGDVRQSCRNIVLVEYASNLVVESVINQRYFQCEERVRMVLFCFLFVIAFVFV